MILSENLDENSFCTVVGTKEILEQVEVKKERENKYVQNEDRLGRDLFSLFPMPSTSPFFIVIKLPGKII